MTIPTGPKPTAHWRAISLALLCHGLILWQGQPVQAQVTVGAPSVVEPATVAVNGPRLVADFAVATGPETGMQLILPESLAPMDGGSALPLRWSRTDSGAEERVGVPIALQPGTITGFRMEADLPDLNQYAARLTVRHADAVAGADEVLGPYVFARAPVPIPANFLPTTLRRAATVWPWLSFTAADGRILVAIMGRNTTDHPIAVDAVGWGALSRDGMTEATVDFSYPVADVSATHTCGAQVAPGAICTVEVQVPGPLPPGRYGLDVTLSGGEGSVSATRVTLEMRAPGWFAALVVALGALFGAAVAHWREVDRPRALAELPLVMLAEDFRRLSRMSQSREVAALTRDRVALIEAALRHGRLGLPDAAPDAGTLTAECNILRQADQAIAAAAAGGAPNAALTLALQALNATLRADPWVATTTSAALTTLEQVWQAEVTQQQANRDIRHESTGESSQILLPTGQLLPGVEADVRAFVRRINRLDLGSALFLAVLIGVGGVAVLWVGDPVWGSGLDVVTAFAAGVATRLTLPSPGAKPLG